MKSTFLYALGTFSIAVATFAAEAALVTRLGGQLVYDTDRNITLLANANLAQSETFGVPGIPLSEFSAPGDGIQPDGVMSYATAVDWIAAMNSNNYLGFNGWRLPLVPLLDPTCSAQEDGISTGTSCTGSEMGHLFYEELGATAGSSVLDTGDPLELAKFSNIQADNRVTGWASFYWPELLSRDGGLVPFAFSFDGGRQASDVLSISGFVWPVHDGDIGAVPLPPAIWLLGSGLIALLGVANRRRVF